MTGLLIGTISSSGAAPPPPDAISNLTATTGYQSISLSWAAPNSNGFAITDYIIEESSDQSSWTVISDGTNTNTSYNRTGLSNGQLVYFRVAAVNQNGQSEYSNISSATTKSPKATGGTISLTNGKWIHTFTSNGTFTPSQSISVDAIVVAGGYNGSSSTSTLSGAGGAGGKVTIGSTTLNTSARTITVGSANGGASSISGWISATGAGVSGGAGRTTNGIGNNGSNGTTSSISGTSYVYGSGGGAGAFSNVSGSNYNRSSAGSGGGEGGGTGSTFKRPGLVAINWGAGGGGGARDRTNFVASITAAGAAGKQGVVIINYSE